MSDLSHLLSAPPGNQAKGSIQSGRKRIVIALDVHLFDRIGMLAAASRVSFGEAARQLIERGLDEPLPNRRRRRVKARVV